MEDELSDRGTRLAPLFESIKKLKDAATKINQERKVWQDFLSGQGLTDMSAKDSIQRIVNIQAMEEKRVWPWMFKKDKVKVREINDRLMMAERAFTDAEGLSGRPWYKHLVCFFLILTFPASFYLSIFGSCFFLNSMRKKKENKFQLN